jgi:CRP-like cAMP-binding protein/anti-anti-sigma regulatory factor
MSGLTLGFTGSYIFSQTIFTYRTGVHDRCVGCMIMCVYMYIVASPVNILEISPLFFLGSTLIFIGYDLMYEWLWEVRHQVFLSEYFIVWFTFVSIHLVGIDFGILIGVLIAICDQILTTAQATGVNRVERRSRAIYTPEDSRVVHEKAYSAFCPKIITLEIIGNLFFGSSLNVLNRIYEDIGLGVDDDNHNNNHPPDMAPSFKVDTTTTTTLETISEVTPLTGHHAANKIPDKTPRLTRPPQYVVLDLMGVTHLDASATRGCFLQLVKMAAKRGIVVCASGVTPKIEWMFRSHEVSYETILDEDDAKAKLLSADRQRKHTENIERILIFSTVAEALEFCETVLLRKANVTFRSFASMEDLSQQNLDDETKEHTISTVLTHFLGCSGTKKAEILDRLIGLRHHREIVYKAGQIIFSMHQPSDAFYVVLHGSVANSLSSSTIHTARQLQPVLSGAGKVSPTSSSTSRFTSSGHIGAVLPVGGIFGFNDYLLGRPRTFDSVVVLDGTRLAKFNRSDMNALETQDPELFSMILQVLLRASNLDLANITDV